MSNIVTIGDATLYRGDCLAVMRTMQDGSVDSIVTDPPYELGFMGKSWDSTGVSCNIEVWREALRVLKPGGHLLAFSGSRTYHRMTCAIEDAGFEIRDQIMWVYGSGFPKSKNLDGDWQGYGTALKPAHEPICMARKPFVGTVSTNVLTHGTGALNIDGCRVATGETLRIGAGKTFAAMHRHEGRARDGEDSANRRYADNGGTNFAMKPGTRGGGATGRWPANLIHDGSDEVRSAFPDANGQQGDLVSHGNCRQSPSGIFGGMRPALDHPARVEDDKSAARFFYCAKASKQDRDEGLHGFSLKEGGVKNDSGRGYSETDLMRKIMRANIHPTVKPTELLRYLWRLVTPPGGTGLDLFMGSGSGGKAAILEGFDYIGIELDEDNDGKPLDYFPVAVARITHAVKTAEQENAQQKLFA